MKKGSWKNLLLVLGFTAVGARCGAQGSDCCGVAWTQTQAAGVPFNHPRGMVVIQSELFVADPDNNRVVVFSLGGGYSRSLAMPSPGRPLDLAGDSAGNLYVACDSGQKVLVLNRTTGANLVPPLSDGVYYRGIGVDPDNQTVFASGQDAQIHWFKLVSGSYAVQTPFGNPVPFNGATLPTGMVKVGTGLYVTSNTTNGVVRFTGDDTAGYTYVGQVTGTSGPTSVTDPYEITADSAGRFFIPSYNQARVTVFNPDWTFNTTCQNTLFGTTTYGVAVDANDNVYLSSDASPEQVSRTQPCFSGGSVTTAPGPGDCFLYPSPARGNQATVNYDMAGPGRVDLKVWNEKAELVARSADTKSAGIQSTSFSIAGFASGVYFYALALTYDSGRVDRLGPKKFAILH